MNLKPTVLSLICLVASLLAGQASIAQSGQLSSAPQLVDVEISAVRIGPVIEEVYYRNSAEEPAALPLPIQVPSRKFRYVGPAEMTLFRQEISANNEILRKPVARVDLPTDARRLLLLTFTQSTEAGEGLHVIPLDISETRFPAGSYRFINFLDSRLAVEIAGDQRIIQSGTEHIFNLGTEDGSGFGARIAYHSSQLKTWKRLLATRWTHRASNQTMVVLINGPDGHPRSFIYASRPD